MRRIIDYDPFGDMRQNLWVAGQWPARWIGAPGVEQGPVVMLFRLEVEVAEPCCRLVHVSADERYILYVNGREVGRGSERGAVNRWFFETYELNLCAGRNVILARVWAAGSIAPHAQISVGPAFLLASEDGERGLSTGTAAWQVKVQAGWQLVRTAICWGRGNDSEIDGFRIDWAAENGEGEGWTAAAVGDYAFGIQALNHFTGRTRMLTPATLPPMKMEPWRRGTPVFARMRGEALEEKAQIRLADSNASLAAEMAGLLRDGAALMVPAHRCLEAIIDLEDYVCAYNGVTVSGGAGAVVSLRWAESLFLTPEFDGEKGDRNQVDGKYFVGEGDRFILDGGAGRCYEGLWWHAGRYLQLVVKTGAEPVMVKRLAVMETGYPLAVQAEYRFVDARLDALAPLMVRTLQMCAHETLMDCPYYEQMMYVGDTRLELLTIYTLSRDDRLPRKAIAMLNASRNGDGRISSRYPSWQYQLIPAFDLLWIGMVYDYALWRGDIRFVAEMMPGVRGTLDHFLLQRNSDGVLRTPAGWNFMDWVPAWSWGVPPVAEDGLCGSLNWLLVYVLKLTSELEDWLGEPEYASRRRAQASALASVLRRHYWSDECGMFADDTARQRFSEHVQCLAILSGELTPEQEIRVFEQALTFAGVARSTIYFSHYLFECAYRLKRPDVFFERLELDWFMMLEKGFKTTYETPLPTRSDCHAWGAHPLYHFYASVAGMRPAALGTRELRIEPLPGELAGFDFRLPGPDDMIRLSGRRERGRFEWEQHRENAPTEVAVTD